MGTGTTEWIVPRPFFSVSVALFCVLSVSIYSTQRTWGALAGAPSLLYHTYVKKRKSEKKAKPGLVTSLVVQQKLV